MFLYKRERLEGSRYMAQYCSGIFMWEKVKVCKLWHPTDTGNITLWLLCVHNISCYSIGIRYPNICTTVCMM